MVNGRLRCLGPAQHLKLRFGNGFEVNVKLQSPDPAAVGALAHTAVDAMRRRLQAQQARRSLSEESKPRRASFSSGHLMAAVLPTVTQSSDAAAVASPLLLESSEADALVIAESGASTQVNADAVKLPRSLLQLVCEALGKPQRVQKITPFQSGAQLHEAFVAEGEEVALRMLLEWWLLEDAAERLQQFMQTEFGSRAQLLERSTAQNFRFRVQLSEEGDSQQQQLSPSDSAVVSTPTCDGHVHMQSALSDIFAKFEACKAQLGIQEYSVGQTTLEQIFNQFAAQQDNPEVQLAAQTAAAAEALAVATVASNSV